MDFTLPQGMRTCKWNQLAKNMIDQLTKYQKTNDRFLNYLAGYLQLNSFSHEKSAALVLGGKIIGWMFVEISETGNFILTFAHVLEEYQRIWKSVPFILLFKETVNAKNNLDDLDVFFLVNADNHKMVHFSHTHLKPYVKRFCKEFHSIKKL